MGAFRFEAADADGAIDRGVIDAESARHARSLLRERGLVPLEVSPVASQAVDARSLVGGRLRAAELALVTRQLASLLAASLPLERALGAVVEQAERPLVRERFAAVRGEVVEAKLAFENRKVDLASDLARQDNEVNRLNKEVFRSAVSVGDEEDRREWAMTMTLVARALERLGDNAVGIGEQVIFVETGLFREFPVDEPSSVTD